MQKINKILVLLLTVLSIGISSCEKKGDMAIMPVRDFRPIEIRGFVLNDTLEQYFDGVKMRECSGQVKFSGKIAFESEKAIKMELRHKKTGQVVYTHEIENKETDQPIRFYYDGHKVTETYPYPDAVPDIEQIAFYFNLPADMPVDVVYGDGSDVNAVTYLARNVQPKQWTEFIKIPPIDGEMYVFLLRAGKKEYLINNDVNYSYMNSGLQLPNTYGYPGGGVQSWYVGLNTDISGQQGLFPQIDLVPLFAK